MENRFKAAVTLEADQIKLSKAPVVIAIGLIYAATIFVQNTFKLSVYSTLVFTVLIVLHLGAYIFLNAIFKHRHWLYFMTQGIIVSGCTIVMPRGHKAILIGLIPILIFQGMVLYTETIKVVINAIIFYGIFCITIVLYDGAKRLVDYLPLLILISVAIRAYSIIFYKQVKLRIQAQKVSQELELAYEKVEELTLANERQRMARDLHDTLSQGLAGVIMQLDAVNANLDRNNTKRAQEIVQNAMDHARKTLSAARLVIDDLRIEKNNDIDFIKSLEQEILRFKATCDTAITWDINIKSELSHVVSKHMLYIVREALSNIAKHAGAENASVEIIEAHCLININIMDDGVGFNVKLLDQLLGQYGILGMTERVRAVGGRIKVKSKIKSGTKLKILIPIEKGIYEKDE